MIPQLYQQIMVAQTDETLHNLMSRYDDDAKKIRLLTGNYAYI